MRTLKTLFIALIVCALLPGLGMLLAPTLLEVSGAPRKADAIVLLGGEDGSRVILAVKLFKAGWAPHIIISGDYEGRRAELLNVGIPEEAILLENTSHNTAENAKFTIALMRAHGFTSALIVTSWFHTRRARNCFRFFGPEMYFRMQPTWQTADVAQSWGSHVPNVIMEYPKQLLYWLRYGI